MSADLVQTLAAHRSFLRWTARGLTDEEAGRRTTTSELCLGGIIKHVSLVEEGWCNFIVQGPEAMGQADEAAMEEHAAGFQMLPGDTLDSLLERYDCIARRTEELINTLPSLDDSQPLPEAPWFEPGARWSARRAILHILAETAQHAGHADIIRESLDGAKTMDNGVFRSIAERLVARLRQQRLKTGLFRFTPVLAELVSIKHVTGGPADQNKSTSDAGAALSNATRRLGATARYASSQTTSTSPQSTRPSRRMPTQPRPPT